MAADPRPLTATAVTLLTAWYGPKEIGKRLAAYEIAAYGSGMFSGFLQAALYTNL